MHPSPKHDLAIVRLDADGLRVLVGVAAKRGLDAAAHVGTSRWRRDRDGVDEALHADELSDRMTCGRALILPIDGAGERDRTVAHEHADPLLRDRRTPLDRPHPADRPLRP